MIFIVRDVKQVLQVIRLMTYKSSSRELEEPSVQV